MSAQRQLPDLEELTFLRRRVAELERQAAEQTRSSTSLSEIRQLFDIFLKQLPALAWMKDEMGRYVYANREFYRLADKMGATCIGCTDHDLWPAEIADRIMTADLNAVSARQPEDSLESLPTGEGERWFRIRRFPFRSKAGKLYMAGIGFDASGEQSARSDAVSILEALHSAEAHSLRLFQSDLVGIMECAGECVIDANDTMLGWLKYAREEVSHLNWRELSPLRYRELDNSAALELRAKGMSHPYEKELLDRDGMPVPVILSTREIEPGSDAFFCFALNLSERRKIESRLLRSQKLESLGLIAGGVAHDFNNLLGTIMGNASLSLDAISPEHPAFKPLHEVVIASRRASELTNQVLAYAGRARFQIKATDLSMAIREIGSLLETTISKKIRLNLDLAPCLPFIDADPGQLQQVIMNLVINASDAIGEQDGDITVSSREIETLEGRRCVCFEVRDTGCGMSEVTKSRIFDPFFTTKANGRGLGLAAVLGIVKNHQGTLLVESEIDVGTTFRVIFPASDVQPERTRPVNPRQGFWGDETILVADDDEGIQRMTRAALERLGYRVLVAGDGEQAVEVFRAHRDEIAVVLLDWAMPVMNGDEALKRILALHPSARILMSSGYAETETLQRVGTPLLAGFVQKPYTTTQLAERLRAAIDSNERMTRE